jgi:hypothetical protein
MLGQVHPISTGPAHQEVKNDFGSYSDFVKKAADEMVDVRDELHVWVQELVDACADNMAKSVSGNTCALQ